MGVEGPIQSSPLKILEERLHADPSRVVLRPFHLGWQAKGAPGGRASKLVHDIAALSEAEVKAEYARVRTDFVARHWQTEKMFDERAEEVDEETRTSISATSRAPASG